MKKDHIPRSKTHYLTPTINKNNMKKQYILLCLIVLNSLMSIAQQSTLTKTLVNRKYGFGYPSLTKKDKMGYPLIEALTIPAIYDDATNATFAEEYENLVGVK